MCSSGKLWTWVTLLPRPYYVVKYESVYRKNLFIIQVYAPTLQCIAKEYEIFHRLLEETSHWSYLWVLIVRVFVLCKPHCCWFIPARWFLLNVDEFQLPVGYYTVCFWGHYHRPWVNQWNYITLLDFLFLYRSCWTMKMLSLHKCHGVQPL